MIRSYDNLRSQSKDDSFTPQSSHVDPIISKLPPRSRPSEETVAGNIIVVRKPNSNNNNTMEISTQSLRVFSGPHFQPEQYRVKSSAEFEKTYAPPEKYSLPKSRYYIPHIHQYFEAALEDSSRFKAYDQYRSTDSINFRHAYASSLATDAHLNTDDMHARKIRRVASPDSKDIEAQAHKILLSIAGHAEQSQESTEGHSLSDALNCSKSVEVPSFVEDSKEVSKEEKDIKQPVEETVALATQPTTQTLPPRKWHAVPSSDSDSVIDIAEENEDEKQLNQSKEVEEKAHMFFGDDKDEDKEMALLREHIAQQSNNSFDIDAMSLDGESYAGSVNEGGNKLKRTDDLAMDYSDEEYELEDDKTPPPSSPVMAAVSGPAASFTNEVQQPTTGMSESKVTVSQKAPSQKPEHLVSKPEEFTTEVLKPQPTMPQPAVPQPAVPQPVMSKPIMPQPIMPQPIMPQSVMPQPTMPHSTMPQPDASQIYTLQLPVGKMPAYQSPSAQSPTSHQPTVPAALPSTSTQRKTSASIKTHSTGSKASQPTAVDSIATNRSHPVPRVNQNQTNSSLALTPIVLVPPQSTAPIEAANTAAESNRLAPYLSYAGNSSPLRWDNTSSTLLMPLDSTSAQTLPLPPVNSQPLVENGSSSSPSLAVEGERAVSTDRPSTAVVNFSHGSPDRYAIPNRDSTFEKIRNLGRFVHTWRIRHAPSACCICFEDNSAEPIESCDNLLCDVRLHASCYQKIKKGSTARIHRRWMCDKCTYLDSSSLTVVCALCPSTAGLFCMIDPNKYSIFWVHYNCAKTFLGENTIAYKPDLGHFDVDIDAIPLVNFEQPCSDCAKSCYSRYGAKIVCRICRTYHHITCIEQYNLKIPEEAYECPDHGSARPKGPDVLRRRRLAASYHRWIGKKNHYLLEEFKKVPRMFGLDYWKSLNLETLSMGKVTEWYRKSIAVIQKTESYPVENTYYNQWVNYVYGLTMSTYSAYEIKNAKVTFSSKHFDEDIGYDFQIANTLTPPRNNTLAVTQSSRAESSRAESSRAESSRAESSRAESSRAESSRAESSRTQTEKVQEDKAQAQAKKVQAEKAQKEKEQAEKVQAEKAQAEKVQAEKAQAEKAQAEKAQAEKAQAEKVQAEKAQAEKVQAEKAQAEKVQAEKAQAEKAQEEKEQAEKVQAKKAQAEEGQVSETQTGTEQEEKTNSVKAEADTAQTTTTVAKRSTAARQTPTRSSSRNSSPSPNSSGNKKGSRSTHMPPAIMPSDDLICAICLQHDLLDLVWERHNLDSEYKENLERTKHKRKPGFTGSGNNWDPRVFIQCCKCDVTVHCGCPVPPIKSYPQRFRVFICIRCDTKQDETTTEQEPPSMRRTNVVNYKE